MKYYSLKAIEQLLKVYTDHDGEINTIKEGSLGWGTTVCSADGFKTAVITEKYVNEWSSRHTVRFYNETPAKYQLTPQEV